MKFKASMVLLTVFIMLTLCGTVSAGEPLNESQNGTVSGDLYVNVTCPWPETTGTQSNTLPNYTNIQSAKVYVNSYAVAYSIYGINQTTEIDANGDGDYSDAGENLGSEILTCTFDTTNDPTVYIHNDHVTHCYSDYQTVYDVTNLITSNNVNIRVTNTALDGYSFDGRIKMIALVVAYNDGDNDKVDYWVLNGQDWTPGGGSSSTSTFNTTSVQTGFTNATLNTVACSSSDGTYSFNNNPVTGNLTTGSYYKMHNWDVTSYVTAGTNSDLTYTPGSGSFKINLATLAVREAGSTPAPVADFTANTTTIIENNNIQFTDSSTNTPTTWAWDFGDGSTSTLQNPTHTYTTAGTYTVSLTATNTGGNDTETKNNYISVIPENYSTYLGGSGSDCGYSVAVDNDGNIYVTGYTGSSNFPTTTDAYQNSLAGGNDVYLTKYNKSGILVYSTYLGGGGDDYGNSIALDKDGNIYITGRTNSGNFPTTTDAYQTSNGGISDIFLAKFNSNGTLVYSTYLGGSNNEYGYGIAVDGDGNSYITGYSASSNFPTTTGAYQNSFAGGYDVILSKFNSSGTLVYSTYLGGESYDEGNGIAVDNEGNIYITGYSQAGNFPITSNAFQTSRGGGTDAFLSKFNSTGALVYSTYLGGSINDIGTGVAVDGDGNCYLTGRTPSSNFPTTTDAYQKTLSNSLDVYLSKFNSSGALVYSTYLGGSDADYGYGIAVDGDGNSYITGHTSSTNFPSTTGAYQTSFAGSEDAFIAKFNNVGSLMYSTYLGGIGADEGLGIAVDNNENSYITGVTGSSDFPVTVGAYQSTSGGANDAFITKRNIETVAPVADFGSITNGPAPLTVQFSDTSSNYPTTWLWNFGDGTTSTEKNPTHTYTNPGSYTVTLNVSNSAGNDEEIKTDYITVTATPPITNFIATPTNGPASLTVQFTDQSLGAIEWAWDFNNDGITDSTQQNPTYTYNSAGTYTVKLNATNAVGSSTEIKTDYINVSYPPLNIQTDTDSYVYSASGDGNFGTATMLYVRQTTSGGLYRSYIIFDLSSIPDGAIIDSATLYAYMYMRTGSKTISAYRVLGDWAETGITWNNQPSFNFIATSVTPIGTTSNVWLSWDVTPDVLAYLQGTTNYGWVLALSDESTSSTSQHGYVRSSENCNTAQLPYLQIVYHLAVPEADFSGTPTSGAAPLQVQFTDTSSNGPTSWSWDFGDGATSTEQNPSHTYSTPGTYTVTLTASNSAGSDEEVKTDFITVVVPIIDLAVSDIVVPENPVACETYQVNVTVTNNGTINVGTFIVKLYDNNTQKQKITLSGLAAGASTTAIFNWTPLNSVNHVLTISADANQQITESNENNNIITGSVAVSASNLADITVSNLTLPETPEVGVTYTINATVTNTGNTATGTFVVKLYDNNTQIQKITLTGLNTGESTTVTFNWTPTTTGNHILSVIADANKQITETNENNNQITSTINASESTRPDITVSNLVLPENPVAGTTYPITVTITNTGTSTTGTFTTKLYDNNTQTQKITIPNLLAGETTTITFNWTPNTTTTHILSVIADTNKQITESNENNNQITKTTTLA